MARDLSQETDVRILQQAVRLLEQENGKLVAKVASLLQSIAALQGQSGTQVQLELKTLELQLAALQKKLFGESSERSARPTDEPKAERPRKGHGRRTQPDLPLLTITHPLPAEELVCDLCAQQLVPFEGQQDSSREIHALRRVFVEVEHVQPKYRCPNGCCIKSAPAPRKLVRGGRYSIGFGVQIALGKYLYHLPLERQVKQLKSEGLVIDSQTLWDQINAVASHLTPVYDKIKETVLAQPVVGVDETTWRVMGNGTKAGGNASRRADGKRDTKRWQVWTLATDSAVHYTIADSRSTAAAAEVLGRFAGVAVCDGYAVYPAVASKQSSLSLAFCWAHVRRKFLDLDPGGVDADCQTVLKMIGELFEVERVAPAGDSEEDLQQRALLRSERSRPITDQIADWAKQVQVIPGSGLQGAIAYMTSHWSGLLRFLDDPRIPITNNLTERANRRPVLGRKNHYGSRSRRGTEVAAILYTVAETAHLSGLDPYAYFELAVERAIVGLPPLLPHQLRDEIETRAGQHLSLLEALVAQTSAAAEAPS